MKAIRNYYSELGVDNFYKNHSNNYVNPHEEIIKELLSIAKDEYNLGSDILDLCCGSGEVTVFLKDYNVVGLDPYTIEAYKTRTKKEALNFSFKDICNGNLSGSYDTIICSFAMHLCKESMLPLLLYNLGNISNKLIILTPNKKPNCNGIFGWYMVDEKIIKRVRMQLYIK